MEQGRKYVSSGDFEFFKVLLPGRFEDALGLPHKFAQDLGDHGELSLQLSGGIMIQIPRPIWPVQVVKERGGVYLRDGWKSFAEAHKLKAGDFLVFLYDGRRLLSVKVFDSSCCRLSYPKGNCGAGPSVALIDLGVGPSHQSLVPVTFTSYLKQCNMGTKKSQYLNVPVEFAAAHAYARRTQVQLTMTTGSWFVCLKHTAKPSGLKTVSFAEGWHRFCVDNGIKVGDSCCFIVGHEGAIVCGEGMDCDVKDEGDINLHVLKVEIIKRDGTRLR